MGCVCDLPGHEKGVNLTSAEPNSVQQYQGFLTAAISRGEAEGWFRLGCVLHDAKRWGSASGCFAKAVSGLREGNDLLPKALTNLGWNLHLSGRCEEGAEHLVKAIRLAPGEGTPYCLLSQVRGTLGDHESALFNAREGVKLQPSLAINRVALSFCLMKMGEWKDGWAEFEHRFAYKIPEFLSRPYPLWRGEEVEHLYLEGEQGLGDGIMGLRWVPLAAQRAKRVTLYVHGALYPLMAHMRAWPENVKVLPLPQPLPEADAWAPLLSLPVALGIDEAGPGEPYIWTGELSWRAGWVKDRQLKAMPMPLTEAALAKNPLFAEAKQFPPPPPRPDVARVRKVGIVWGGSPDHEQAHHRDCPLAYFLRLAEISDIEVHALQFGPAQSQVSEMGAFGLIRDRSPEITNLLNTASILAEMDLLISVDTSAAHLAGAMGVPVWVLLNQRGQDFRWPREGDTTPWYDSMRLFRRGLHEGWQSLMERVDARLREVVKLEFPREAA